MSEDTAIDKSSVTPQNLKELKITLRKGVHKPPVGVELDKSPEVYRRDALRNWLHSKPIVELNEVVELENMFVYLKGAIDSEAHQRYLDGNSQPSVREIAYWRFLKDTLVDLNKMKYGEKRTNVNVGFNYNDIQEMMLGVHKDEPK